MDKSLANRDQTDHVNGLEVEIRPPASTTSSLGTLVFIHGVGNGIRGWDRVVAEIPDRWNVVRYSLRGHGESHKPPGPYSLDDFVEDHSQLIDALGLQQYHLVGCSLGGLIAQGIALSQPSSLQRLILISSVAGRDDAQKARVQQRLEALEESGPVGMAEVSAKRWFTPDFLRSNPDVVEERISEFKQNDLKSYLASYRVLAENDLFDELSRIDNETLAITGEFDVGSPPAMVRNIVSQMPRSVAYVVEGQKHMLLVEVPGLIAQLVSTFAAGGIEAVKKKWSLT